MNSSENSSGDFENPNLSEKGTQRRVRSERWIQDMCGGARPPDNGIAVWLEGIGWKFMTVDEYFALPPHDPPPLP